MQHIRPMCVIWLLSLGMAASVAATTEFRLGDGGITWYAARIA